MSDALENRTPETTAIFRGLDKWEKEVGPMLVEIQAQNNKITNIPHEYGYLCNLRHFDLYNNHIENIEIFSKIDIAFSPKDEVQTKTQSSEFCFVERCLERCEKKRKDLNLLYFTRE